MTIPLFQVDAFAEERFRGNPAAVCPLVNWLPDDQLQSIAEENNLSETAFYAPEGDQLRLRWFTPRSEVDLCGHATLAASYVYFDLNPDAGDSVTFLSRGGLLGVSRDGEKLTLDFPAQPATACPAPPTLTEALGGEPVECYRAANWMAVLPSEAAVRALQPDMRLLKKLDLQGVIVTAPGEGHDFVSRFFAPKFGIDEDPVTGSAHCTLAPYWSKRLGKNPLQALQVSQRTGLVDCEVRGERVFLSGSVVPYLRGEISL